VGGIDGGLGVELGQVGDFEEDIPHDVGVALFAVRMDGSLSVRSHGSTASGSSGAAAVKRCARPSSSFAASQHAVSDFLR
jgi:hypothetical protein